MDIIASAYSRDPARYIKDRAFNEAKKNKKILLCDGWNWKEEGAKVFDDLKSTFKVYASIVEPREKFIHVLKSIKFHADMAEAAKGAPRRYLFTNPIIGSIVGEDRGRGAKSFLMRWRLRVIKQLKTQQEEICAEHEALTLMQKSLERSMLIPKSKCMTLRMRREKFAIAVARRDELAHLIRRCASINTCKSRTHMNAEGCMRCPVIFIKNEPMIRAIDRGNGLPVTVHIDHEMSMLEEEYAKQCDCTEDMQATMHALRVVMEKKLIYDMQAWYACRMANRRARRQYERMQWSLYYYRIRKLSRMKRRLDYLHYHNPSEEDLEAFEYTYSDLQSESAEYRRMLAIKKRYIVGKYAPMVWEKLIKLYATRKEILRREANERELARRRELRQRQEKKRRKMLKLAEDEDDSEEAIKARLLEKVRMMQNKRYICHYVDCHKREFKSQQRLDIHLSQHRRQQLELKKIRDMHARNKKRREEEERVFLGRLTALRVLKSGLEASNSLEERTGPNKLKFLQAILSARDAAAEQAVVPTQNEGTSDDDQQIDIVSDKNLEVEGCDLKTKGDLEGGACVDNNYDECTEVCDVAKEPEDSFALEMVSDEMVTAPDGEFLEFEENIDDDDELDPFYDINGTAGADITYGATGSSLSKVDIFDEEFMAEMDAELMKPPPGQSDDDGDTIFDQYSMASIVLSCDYEDILPSRDKNVDASGNIDSICLSDRGDFYDEESNTEIVACADNAAENSAIIAPVEVLETAQTVENFVPVESGVSNSINEAESPRKPSGFATFKKRHQAILYETAEQQQDDDSGKLVISSKSAPTFADRFKKNRIEVSSSLSELRMPYIPKNMICEVQERFTWMRQQNHLGLVFDNMRAPLRHLELLSKHPDVECPYRIPLVPPLVRMGTLDSNEVVFTLSGSIKKEARVAKQHVVIYVPLHTEYKDPDKALLSKSRSHHMSTRSAQNAASCSTSFDENDGDEYAKTDGTSVTIVDNHTIWGTYLVSAGGVRKVPTVTSGFTQTMSSGDLLCIGVRWRGPETLTPVEASSAVMVYRVRCSADTDARNL